MCYIHISALIAESLKRRGQCAHAAALVTFCSMVFRVCAYAQIFVHKHCSDISVVVCASLQTW